MTGVEELLASSSDGPFELEAAVVVTAGEARVCDAVLESGEPKCDVPNAVLLDLPEEELNFRRISEDISLATLHMRVLKEGDALRIVEVLPRTPFIESPAAPPPSTEAVPVPTSNK